MLDLRPDGKNRVDSIAGIKRRGGPHSEEIKNFPPE
jgi:hypothetical protein